ncbi:hypothetical protein HYZ05_01615 [Candidatus Daviesbacteria bacterium]|nr:hypothetical protein [Candidatus Daviesbacteria bacterium]
MASSSEREVTHPGGEWVPVEKPVESLEQDLLAVRPGGTIRIFCGEADPLVYNDDRFLEAAKRAKKSGATLWVITGPILLVDSAGRNGLLELASPEQDVVQKLYHRAARGSIPHFRIVDTIDIPRYYVEQPHAPLLPGDQRWCATARSLSRAQFERRVESDRILFDSWLTRLEETRFSDVSKLLPITIDRPTLYKLLIAARNKQLVFKYLGPADLLSLMSHSNNGNSVPV